MCAMGRVTRIRRVLHAVQVRIAAAWYRDESFALSAIRLCDVSVSCDLDLFAWSMANRMSAWLRDTFNN